MAKTVDEIADLARAMTQSEADIEELQQQLKAASERLRVLREETIPSIMFELGLSSLKLSSGHTLTIKDEVYCSLPKEPAARAAALQWLMQNNGGGLIKGNLSLAFGKEDIEQAYALAEELVGRGLQPTLVEDVHWQTLKAFVKECLAGALPIDLALFNARSVPTAKLTLKKGS